MDVVSRRTHLFCLRGRAAAIPDLLTRTHARPSESASFSFWVACVPCPSASWREPSGTAKRGASLRALSHRPLQSA